MTAVNGPTISYKTADDIFKAGDKDSDGYLNLDKLTNPGFVMMEQSSRMMLSTRRSCRSGTLQVLLSSSSVRTCCLLSLRAAHALRRRSAALCRSALATARFLE